MARPKLKNLNYFPFNVDFFEDDKIQLIEAEFGTKGVMIAIRLLCKIYKENGYYYQWGDDQCLLFAKKAGDGIVPSLVSEVVNGLIKRSFFDKGVYDSFKILTSKGIQDRFIKALERSDSIEIVEDFLCKNVIISKNVTLIKVNVTETQKKETLMPQRKEKEIKEDKSKEKEEVKSFRFSPPTQDEVYNYFLEKKLNEPIAKLESEKFINFYDSKGWVIGKTKMQKWKSAASGWINRMNDFNNNQNKNYGQKNKSNNTDFTTNR